MCRLNVLPHLHYYKFIPKRRALKLCGPFISVSTFNVVFNALKKISRNQLCGEVCDSCERIRVVGTATTDSTPPWDQQNCSQQFEHMHWLLNCDMEESDLVIRTTLMRGTSKEDWSLTRGRRHARTDQHRSVLSQFLTGRMFVRPNILRTLRRTMIRFLIELLVRRIWFGQSKRNFILNWLVMRCKLRPELAADAQQTAWSKM